MYHVLWPIYLIRRSICVQQSLIWTNLSDQETEIGGRVLIYNTKVKSLRSYNEFGRNTKSISNSFIEVLVVRNGAQSLPHTLDLLRIQILNWIKAFKGKSVQCLGGNFWTQRRHFPNFPMPFINKARLFEKNVPRTEKAVIFILCKRSNDP